MTGINLFPWCECSLCFGPDIWQTNIHKVIWLKEKVNIEAGETLSGDLEIKVVYKYSIWKRNLQVILIFSRIIYIFRIFCQSQWQL